MKICKGKRHKICFYSDVYKPVHCGLVTSLKRILGGLVKSQNFDVHLLTYNESLNKRQPVITDKGFLLHSHGLGEGQIAYLYVQSATRKLFELQRKYNYELLVAFYAHIPLLAVGTIGKTCDVPYIVCARGSDINENMKGLLHRKVLRSYFHDARAVISVSAKMSDNIRKWGLSPANGSLITIPNSINPLNFSVYHAVKFRIAPRYDFLFIGGARPVKKFDIIINAMGILKKSGIFPRVCAVLVPHRQHPNMIEEYKELASRTGVLDLLNILGPQASKKVKKLYSVSKCCIIPSDSEGCSNIILEGMASGCYVLSRKVAMPPNLVGRKNMVFSNEVELATCMQRIMDAPAGLVQENVDLVSRYYGGNREVSAYEEALLAALG